MDIEKIRPVIREEFKKAVKIQLDENLTKVLEDWMEKEILKTIVSTDQIKKEDVRAKSIMYLFAKKFEKIQKLLKTLEKHELLENSLLFDEILELL